MMELLEFALFAFTSLFTVINPVGILPIFLSMTQDMETEELRKTAFKATATALAALLFFALSGKFIFDFFYISIDGLKIVGGVLFFIMGYEMLLGRMSRTKGDTVATDTDTEFAVTPLGIPMICGPGAITVSVVLMQDNPEWSMRLVLIATMVAVCGATLLLLLTSRTIARVLGSSGSRVLTRIMGLIVMMIAVNFFFAGLKPIVQDILGIPTEPGSHTSLEVGA